MAKKMRVTRHNGRAGKNGVYNPKHNDRSFDIDHADHINADMTQFNFYWDCVQGIRQGKAASEKDFRSFEEVERIFYQRMFSGFVEGQNARNEKNRHPERNRTVEDLLKDKRTCPEETIYQIGNIDASVDPELLLTCVMEFMNYMQEKFGDHVRILDWSLHMDEGTPHIHERHVFVWENEHGELCPRQENALEVLGFEMPEPDKKKGKNNNRKMSFDKYMREHFLCICQKYEIPVEIEPIYGGKEYLEKMDFIIENQKKRLAEIDAKHEKKLAELEATTLKIEELDTLITEVSEDAYQIACEVVADTVRAETTEHNIQIISDYQTWLASSERKAPKKLRDFAIERMENIKNKIRSAAAAVMDKVKKRLQEPAVKKANVQQIEQKAKRSITAKLKEKKILVAEREANREKARSQGLGWDDH